MNIPLVDVARQHLRVADEIRRDLDAVLDATAFIRGPQVEAFERAYAQFCGVSHCIGVGSGTDALELAVRALGIRADDEVIVPANSFIATALGPIRAGASVVLVDCVEDTALIDVDQVARAVGPRTRAIIPVHLYGQMAPMAELRGVVGDVPIIEDAAQSHGASQGGIRSGAAGVIGATSFYPGKNLGAYGDAGAVTTDDAGIAELVRRLGNWGSGQKYHHPVAGFNSRLDTVQAVVLSAKLARLEEWNAERQAAAARYDEMLEGIEPIVRPTVLAGNEHIWHLYVVRVPHRDSVLARLHAVGIGAGVHYPIPMHLQGALKDLEYGPGSFPVTERLAGEILSLPMFPGITTLEQEFVIEQLISAVLE